MGDSLFIRRQNRAYLFLVDIYWALKLGGGQLIYKKAKQGILIPSRYILGLEIRWTQLIYKKAKQGILIPSRYILGLEIR